MPRMNPWWEPTKLAGAALEAQHLNVTTAQEFFDLGQRVAESNAAAVDEARHRAGLDPFASVRGWPYR